MQYSVSAFTANKQVLVKKHRGKERTVFFKWRLVLSGAFSGSSRAINIEV